LGSIAAMRIPSFTLAAIEGWRAETNLFDYGPGYRIPPTVIPDGFWVDELGPEKPVRRSIEDAPRAQRIVEILCGINGSSVSKTTTLTACAALHVGCNNRTRGDGVRVIIILAPITRSHPAPSVRITRVGSGRVVGNTDISARRPRSGRVVSYSEVSACPQSSVERRKLKLQPIFCPAG